MHYAVLIFLSLGQMVDPQDWSFQHISAKGKIRFVQTCRGPASCTTEAYDIKREKKLWSAEGAIGSRGETIIHDDGLSVIRITPVLPLEDVGEIEAIAFYRKGLKVRSWRVRELIDNPAGLPVREKSRGWVASSGFSEDGKHFEIRLVNGAGAQFELKTGERKSVRPAPKREP